MIVHSDLQNEDASDPAQIILLTLAIFYVEEVSDSLILRNEVCSTLDLMKFLLSRWSKYLETSQTRATLTRMRWEIIQPSKVRTQPVLSTIRDGWFKAISLGL